MFRIYFESGIAKILGHDPQWRDFSAMDQYYQNGPLPTWIAWYAHQLPHAFHAATAFLTLALELVLIFAIFLPRRSRIVLFFAITAWQIGVILTSNYAFLNYLVLVLGFLLLDDQISGTLFSDESLSPRSGAGRSAKLARPSPPVGAGILPFVDLLCHFRAARPDAVPVGTASDRPDPRVGTVSHCQRIRAVCRDDARAIRN